MASRPLTPEQIAELQAGAALMSQSPLFNSAGGLASLQAGTLNPLDPLYNYAQTAPVLSLRGNRDWESLNFQALPDTNYRLVVGGEVLGSASTPEEVARLVEAANQISERGGAQVDVRLQREVQTATPEGQPATAFDDVFANRPNNTGALGTILPAGLALVGGLALGPLIQAAPAVAGAAAKATALGTGLGAAAGMGAGSLATGSSVEDALIKAALAGVTAGGLQAAGIGGGAGGKVGAKVAGAKSSLASGGLEGFTTFDPSSLYTADLGLGQLAGIGGGGAAGGGIAGLADDALMTVVGQRIPQAVAGSVLPSAIGTAAGTMLPDLVSDFFGRDAINRDIERRQFEERMRQQEADQIEVTGQRIPQATVPPAAIAVPGIGGAIGIGLGAGGGGGTSQAAQTIGAEDAQIDVTGQRPLTSSGWALPAAGTVAGGAALASGAGAGGANVTQYTPPPSVESIQSTAAGMGSAPEIVVTAAPTGATGSLGVTLPGLAMTLPAMTAAQAVAAGGGGKKPLTASDYIRAGLGGLSAIQGIANLFGAGGGGGAGGLISNQGALPQFAPLNRPRRAVDFDPFTYGQRAGEFQFFENNTLPALAAPATPAFNPNINTGAIPEDQRFARGGKVSGIGGGQDDKIPALLSDGEYVISAQDVSDLGDGSNEEGARRLDEMRKLIRKGAGRKNIRSIAKPQKDVKSLLRAVK